VLTSGAAAGRPLCGASPHVAALNCVCVCLCACACVGCAVVATADRQSTGGCVCRGTPLVLLLCTYQMPKCAQSSRVNRCVEKRVKADDSDSCALSSTSADCCAPRKGLCATPATERVSGWWRVDTCGCAAFVCVAVLLCFAVLPFQSSTVLPRYLFLCAFSLSLWHCVARPVCHTHEHAKTTDALVTLVTL